MRPLFFRFSARRVLTLTPAQSRLWHRLRAGSCCRGQLPLDALRTLAPQRSLRRLLDSLFRLYTRLLFADLANLSGCMLDILLFSSPPLSPLGRLGTRPRNARISQPQVQARSEMRNVVIAKVEGEDNKEACAGRKPREPGTMNARKGRLRERGEHGTARSRG